MEKEILKISVIVELNYDDAIQRQNLIDTVRSKIFLSQEINCDNIQIKQTNIKQNLIGYDKAGLPKGMTMEEVWKFAIEKRFLLYDSSFTKYKPINILENIEPKPKIIDISTEKGQKIYDRLIQDKSII